MQLSKQLQRADIEPHLNALKGWLRGNVAGMYVGRKRKNGHDTDQWSVILHVQYKKSADRLALDGDELIPPFIELPIAQKEGGHVMVKVPTDIQEIGPLEAPAPAEKPQPMASWDRVRPAPGGYQIQPQGLNATGTLGASFAINGQFRMISNNHVMSWNGQYTRIYQPDTTAPVNYLAPVSGFVPITLYPNSNQFNPVYNPCDLAWCNVNGLQCAPQIQGIGVPTGFAAPAVNMQVSYYGAFTDEVVHTSIATVNYIGIVRMMGNQYAWFENMMMLAENYSMPGDSGSVLVNNQMQMVGMLVSGSVFRTLCCLIPTQLIQ